MPDWWRWIALGGVVFAVGLGFLSVPQEESAPESQPAAEVAAETPVPEASPARREVKRATPPAAEIPMPEKEPEPESAWKQQIEISPLDDSKTIYFDLEAEEAIQGLMGGLTTPVLSFVCSQGDLEAYVMTGIAAAPGRRRDFAPVRIRFDKGEAEDVRMARSTQDDALFFQKPNSFAARILENQEMVFGFTPAGSGLAVTTFRLFGLRGALREFQAECGLAEFFASEADDDGGPDAADPDAI